MNEVNYLLAMLKSNVQDLHYVFGFRLALSVGLVHLDVYSIYIYIYIYTH